MARTTAPAFRKSVPGYARRHVLYPFAWRTQVLVVPGLNDSGPSHWQTCWQQAHVGMMRVQQEDWARPDLDAWAERVAIAAQEQPAPPLVVAHSFGCLATVRAVARHGARLSGALLAAPADPARFGIDLAEVDHCLPFPSTLVASTNDPWLKLTKAGALAVKWGSRLLTLESAGHINVDSGHGRWPEGLHVLRDLAERAASTGSTRAPRGVGMTRRPSRPSSSASAMA